MTAYRISHVDELPELAGGSVPIRPVRHHFGISAFGVNAWVASKVGDRLVPEHTEDSGHEELYVVLRGRARFELDGEQRDAPAGTLVYVPAGVNRTAFAEEAGTAILAVGSTPGEAYEVGGWELFHPYRERYQEGKYEEIVDEVAKVADENEHGVLLYNAACLEALTGRTDEAFEHLRRSIAASEQFREYAKHDSDLDSIRDDPRFAEIAG